MFTKIGTVVPHVPVMTRVAFELLQLCSYAHVHGCCAVARERANGFLFLAYACMHVWAVLLKLFRFTRPRHRSRIHAYSAGYFVRANTDDGHHRIPVRFGWCDLSVSPATGAVRVGGCTRVRRCDDV